MATINGGAGSDTLSGFGDNDVINGFGNRDSLSGGGGNDLLSGGAGFDTLSGGTGNDTVFGGIGLDTMLGGLGVDTMSTFFFSGNYVFDMTSGETNFAGETATGFENSVTGSGSDRVTGTSFGNRIETNAGNDVAFGLAGNDALFGGAGADRLMGGPGNDLLNGGLGVDRLAGGTGRDSFVFTAQHNVLGSGSARILDFSRPDDTIRLDDAVYGGAPGVLPASAFHAGPTATAASHRILHDATTGNLFFDPDGTGPVAKVKFAQINPQLTVLADDFAIF